MQKYTETVAAWLVKCQVIEEQEKELYCYAMESYIILVAYDYRIIVRNHYG